MDKAKVTPHEAACELVESPMWFIREVLVKHQTTVMEVVKELADENKRLKRRVWQGLTDEEIMVCGGLDGADTWAFEFAYAIEAKLKEKNHDQRRSNEAGAGSVGVIAKRDERSDV